MGVGCCLGVGDGCCLVGGLLFVVSLGGTWWWSWLLLGVGLSIGLGFVVVCCWILVFLLVLGWVVGVGLVGSGLEFGSWVLRVLVVVKVWVLATKLVCGCWLLLVWVRFNLLGFNVTLGRVGWWLVIDCGWWLSVGCRVG